MTKKRRSLQSLWSPSFLHAQLPDPLSSPRTSRARSGSTATTGTQDSCDSLSSLPDLSLPDLPPPSRDSPPPDLLDEDPFANLSPAPSLRRARPPSLVLLDTLLDDAASLPPRSPLAMSATDASSSRFSSPSSSAISLHSLPWTPPPTPTLPKGRPRLIRPKSSAGAQVRPAYTRPAFTPRPSLPSLNTLAQSHVVIPKVRRGRVGAQLPAEPWGLDESPESRSPSRSPEARRRRHVRRPTELSTIRDSRMVLDGQPFFVGEGSPLDHKAKLTEDGAQELVINTLDTNLTPHLLRAYSDPYPCRADTPPSATPSLYPSSPTTSTSSYHSADPFLPLEHVYPDVTYASSSNSRNTRFLDSDLVATLEYDYADAVSKLGQPPSPNTSIVIVPTSPLNKSQSEASTRFEPGTSADTVRTLMCPVLNRPVSEEPELLLSPDSSTSDFSLSTTSGHSRSSSVTSTDYDEELLDDDSERAASCSDGIPWPARAHTPPLSTYYRFPGTAPFGIDDDLTECLSPVGSRTSFYSDSDGDEPMDAGEDGVRRAATSSRSGGSSYNSSSANRANGNSSGYGSSGQGGSFGGHGGAGGGGRRNGGGDDRYRRPIARANVSASSESETSSEEEDSTDEEDYQTAAPSMVSADDDVPLAQQIPTALNAQRTIRRQVRDEQDQRRRERTLRADDRTLRPRSPNDRSEAVARSASAKVRAAQENGNTRTLSGTTTRSHQMSESISGVPKLLGRTRTKTLPGNATNPISVGDLTKKLLGVQSSGTVPVGAGHSKRPSLELNTKPIRVSSTRPPSRDTSLSRGQEARDVGRATSLFRRPSRTVKEAEKDDGRGRALRPMRSFHRPNATAADVTRSPPLPAGALGRSATVSQEHASQIAVPAVNPTSVPKLPEEHRALERAKSARAPSRRPSGDRDRDTVRPPLPEPESISAALRARTRKPSVIADTAPTASHGMVSPFAPLSATSPTAAQSKMQTLWQQRIFVGNMQKYVVVEIGPSTSAGEVLQSVDSQGALDDGAGSGGWMLWEVAQDFGMERPIRSFEMLSDVCGSWNTDKIVNLLVIKKTLLAPILSRTAVPRSSPICSGYVQHEYKRGKWQKRWMELREHSLWLSKRDNAKDSVFLCSLNNFDGYYVTRPHKAPKSYVFAVKSTDSLTFFENTADYVHVFASGEGEGKNWLEKILLARSYVLYQERNVISSTTGGLARAGTRAGQRPVQPLIAVAPQKAEGPIASASSFEPGSLLAKRQP